MAYDTGPDERGCGPPLLRVPAWHDHQLARGAGHMGSPNINTGLDHDFRLQFNGWSLMMSLW